MGELKVDDCEMRKTYNVDSGTLDSLIFFSLGITLDDEWNVILESIIAKAYKDATNQGAFNTRIPKGNTKLREQADKAHNQAASLLKNCIEHCKEQCERKYSRKSEVQQEEVIHGKYILLKIPKIPAMIQHIEDNPPKVVRDLLVNLL